MEILFNKMEELEEQSSNINKDILLRKILEDEPEAEEFFRLTFNDTVYGLDQKTFYAAFPCEDKNVYRDVSDWLYTFPRELSGPTLNMKDLSLFASKMENLSGSNQIIAIREFFKYRTALEKKWICRALLQDLRCGIKMKTYNKVVSRLGLKKIEKFSLQLCGKVDLNDKIDVEKRLSFPCCMECKYDGIRLQAEIYTDGSDKRVCRLTSRRGKDRTDTHPEVCDELIRLFPDGDIILDGEIVADSFQKLTRLDDDSQRRYIVFDLLIDEKLPYINRWDNLVNLFDSRYLGCITDFKENQIGKGNKILSSSVILLAEHFTANNQEELIAYYDELNGRGEEGIVVKLLNRIYERDSRKNMFKCKKVFTADLRVTGWKYGDGKRASKVATLSLEDETGKVQCDVGSGIDDYWCDRFTEDPDSWVGKICEIKYNELTETGSIRHPRFVTIRDDKVIPDNLRRDGKTC